MNCKVLFIVILGFVVTASHAQDGAFAGYHLTLQFDSFEVEPSDSIVAIEFFKSDLPLTVSNASNRSVPKLVRCNIDSANFELFEGASFIGSSPKTILPPTIYMNIVIRSFRGNGISLEYTKTIPIKFEKPLENLAIVSLLNINVNSFLQNLSDPIVIKVLSKESYEIVHRNMYFEVPAADQLTKFELNLEEK